MQIRKISFVLILLTIETVLQVLYLSIKTKFFEDFHHYDSFLKIFGKQSYYFGSVKLLLGAVAYGLFYFASNSNTSILKIALQHSLVFFTLMLLTSFLFLQPSNNFIDIIVLVFIAFLVSLGMVFFKRNWL